MRGLSREQFKRAGDVDYRLSTDSHSAVVLDPKDFCGLMATQCFDIVKCMLYSRSGSLSCRRCPTRYPLARTKDVIWSIRGSRMATQGICSKCEQNKTLVAGGQCHRCKYGDWKNLSKTEVLKLLGSGSVRVRKNTATIPKVEPTPLQKALTESAIMLDFSKDQELFTRILESAKRSRRPAGQETLYLLEQAIEKSNSGLDKLKKIVDKVRKYPIPEGSPREVFAKTLGLISLRIDELLEES